MLLTFAVVFAFTSCHRKQPLEITDPGDTAPPVASTDVLGLLVRLSNADPAAGDRPPAKLAEATSALEIASPRFTNVPIKLSTLRTWLGRNQAAVKAAMAPELEPAMPRCVGSSEKLSSFFTAGCAARSSATWRCCTAARSATERWSASRA